MKKLLLLIPIFIFFQTCLNAQGKNVDAGMRAFDIGDHKTAVKEFDLALADESKLKEKVRAKAFLHRGKAKIGYITKVMRNEGITNENNDRLVEYGTTLYPDLKQAQDNDPGEKLADEIKPSVKKAEAILAELSKASMKMAANNALSPEEKNAIYKNVIQYCDASIAINDNNYVPYTMKASCLLAMGEKTEALSNFHNADNSFFRSAPKRGDLEIAYTYMHIAELEVELNRNKEIALDAIKEGRERLTGEMAKISRLSDLRPNAKANYSRRFDELKMEIDKLETRLKLGEN